MKQLIHIKPAGSDAGSATLPSGRLSVSRQQISAVVEELRLHAKALSGDEREILDWIIARMDACIAQPGFEGLQLGSTGLPVSDLVFAAANRKGAVVTRAQQGHSEWAFAPAGGPH